MVRRVLSYVVGVVVLAVAVSAQERRPTFEVASVKRVARTTSPLVAAVGAVGSNRIVQRGTTFRRSPVTLLNLIQTAYDVEDYQVVDSPAWAAKDIFEVTASTGARPASHDEIKVMLQSLLEQRFQLVISREPRVIPHFALVKARADGQLGPNVEPTDDCRRGHTRLQPFPEPAGAHVEIGCGDLSAVARSARRWIRAPVIDRTGITGTFHFFLHVSAEDSPLPEMLRGVAQVPRAPQVDLGLPSFREALRDQLGFRVESSRGPLDVLVIKSVQQPTEN
jgi:uncharacterized protein (TIGR03435 family)